MRAKTFLEIHHSLLNGEPLDQGLQKHPRILFNGLCYIMMGERPLIKNPVFELFIPTPEERVRLSMSTAYWCDSLGDIGYMGTNYNDLRQNIILLCAAINGEL